MEEVKFAMVNVVVIWVVEITETDPTLMPLPDTETLEPEKSLPLIVTLNVLPSRLCCVGEIELTVGAVVTVN